MATLVPVGPSAGSFIDTEARPYTLNVDAALIKKLKTARRNISLEVHYKQGSLVIYADLATFELLKRAMLQYYSVKKPNRSIYIKEVYDRKRVAITEYTIRVQCAEHSNTLNIYPTTSRYIVNGKGVQGFIDNDLPELHSMVQDAQSACGYSFEYKNRTLQLEIEKAPNKKYEKASVICAGCNRNCKKKGTFSTFGNYWIHYKCEKLSKSEIEYIEDKNNQNKQYKCIILSPYLHYVLLLLVSQQVRKISSNTLVIVV
ncbi:hypothetical protein DPMN_042206 [Dreissena polymorpha]|uniref:Uncharacterized protein n=1 Tax=Dreissena polymorpha TaxID=45954 RepID=A0A9D4HYL4_DREPO|nr:hypothetical protein DPMN_042206 [Dreissena polymorpha]